MPSPSDFGFWIDVADDTQPPGPPGPPGPPPTAEIWPGGYFDSLDQWQVVPLQVFQLGDYFPGHTGFSASVFGSQNASPLDPYFGSLIGGKTIPRLAPYIRGGANFSDVVQLRGKPDPSGAMIYNVVVPRDRSKTFNTPVWVLNNPTPFSSNLSSGPVSIVPNLYKLPFKINDQIIDPPIGSGSLSLSSKIDIGRIIDYGANQIVRGPYVISKNAVSLTSGQYIQIWWRAKPNNMSTTGYALDAYLLNVGPDSSNNYNDINLPTYQQPILSTYGFKTEPSDHALKVQDLVKLDTRKDVTYDRKVFEATAISKSRPIGEIEFRPAWAKVALTGTYKLVFVHSAWGSYTGGATTEIAAIRVF